MSAPKPLKAMSLRDSLAKTVRLLTKQGVDVQFRGYQPRVEVKGNKVHRLVLPEINDSASPELITALQGFLDHEVGHIFYTPFSQAEKFAQNSAVRHSLCNIVEDIRLEKLMPRELPGTKENLERMYENVMGTFFGPPALEAKTPGISKSDAFNCVLVVGMRALAGQKAFQKFMDDNNLWPHFMPLVAKMPDLSRRLRTMETFADVTKIVEDILEALKPDKPEEGDKPDPNADPSLDPDAKAPADKDADGEEDEDADDTEGSGGEGHGDGEGTDDGEDDEDAGDCKGGPGDDDGDADGDGDDDGEESDGASKSKDSQGDADETDGDDGAGDTPADNDLEGDTESKSSGKDGKENRSLRDALAMLEPTQRRALFLYKKKKQTVAEIASDLNITEEETVEKLAAARKRLRDLLNGG